MGICKKQEAFLFINLYKFFKTVVLNVYKTVQAKLMKNKLCAP